MGWGNATTNSAAQARVRAQASTLMNQQAAPVSQGPSAGYTAPNGGSLGPSSFPMSGFSNPNSFQYLMQALGMSGQQGGMGMPQQPGYQPTPQQPSMGINSFGNMDFGSIFAGLLGQSQGYKPQMGNIGGAYSGQPGPAQNPLSGLNQYAGPFGNGGGYFGQRSSITPMMIKAPANSYGN